MFKRHGFTLIELLTVIAIIAVLAAIIFPVYARAKDSAVKSSDISEMSALRTALQLYRADQGAYPPALLGYATYYDSQGTDVVPADRIRGFLYPKRVESFASFRPAYARFEETEVTKAQWPAADPRAVGTAPVLDLNGDGRVTEEDDDPRARQAFNYVDDPGFVCDDLTPCGDADRELVFYRASGYDVADSGRSGAGGTLFELRYALFWTEYALVGNGQGGKGSAFDDPRQLGYAEPPDQTLMFWNANFRERDSQGNVLPGRRDIAVFVGGAARPFDSAALAERSWRVQP